jgi:hypothetical protein
MAGLTAVFAGTAFGQDILSALDKADAVVLGDVVSVTRWTSPVLDSKGQPLDRTAECDVFVVRNLAVVKGTCPAEVRVVSVTRENHPKESTNETLKPGERALLTIRHPIQIAGTGQLGFMYDYCQRADADTYATVPDASCWTCDAADVSGARLFMPRGTEPTRPGETLACSVARMLFGSATTPDNGFSEYHWAWLRDIVRASVHLWNPDRKNRLGLGPEFARWFKEWLTPRLKSWAASAEPVSATYAYATILEAGDIQVRDAYLALLRQTFEQGQAQKGSPGTTGIFAAAVAPGGIAAVLPLVTSTSPEMRRLAVDALNHGMFSQFAVATAAGGADPTRDVRPVMKRMLNDDSLQVVWAVMELLSNIDKDTEHNPDVALASARSSEDPQPKPGKGSGGSVVQSTDPTIEVQRELLQYWLSKP